MTKIPAPVNSESILIPKKLANKSASPDPHSIVIPMKPVNKSASEWRKVTKPIMEKKRRARINKSLDQIKDILKENFNEVSKKNQLEKADILEMTVKYLKLVTKDQFLKRTLTDSNVSNVQLMQTGFQDCKQKVNQFIAKFDPQLNQRLNDCLIKVKRQKFESMDCQQDIDSPLNLSIHDNMVMNNSSMLNNSYMLNNSFMLNTPNSAASTNSQETVFFPNSSPSTPNSERSMSPVEFTINHQFRPWRPF